MNVKDERRIWLGNVHSVMETLAGPDELTPVQRRRMLGKLLPVAIGLTMEVSGRKGRPAIPALDLAALRLDVLTSEPYRAYIDDAARVIAKANVGRPPLSEASIKTRRGQLRRTGKIDTLLPMFQKAAFWDQELAILAERLSKTRRRKVRK